jgi:hypothetical protein
MKKLISTWLHKPSMASLLCANVQIFSSKCSSPPCEAASTEAMPCRLSAVSRLDGAVPHRRELLLRVCSVAVAMPCSRSAVSRLNGAVPLKRELLLRICSVAGAMLCSRSAVSRLNGAVPLKRELLLRICSLAVTVQVLCVVFFWMQWKLRNGKSSNSFINWHVTRFLKILLHVNNNWEFATRRFPQRLRCWGLLNKIICCRLEHAILTILAPRSKRSTASIRVSVSCS